LCANDETVRQLSSGSFPQYYRRHAIIADESVTEEEASMKLFTSKEFNSLDDLFIDQLRDLYDAEQRITKALPKMISAASAPALKQAFESHLRETESQVGRLDRIFEALGEDTKRETCLAMKGIIEEGEEIVEAKGDPNIKDAALIAAAQRVEHYEMAGYGTARSFALRLGNNQAATLLEQTLGEEKSADEKLTRIAESQVNLRATAASR
jgi:ferritin-like metal-binding protein YciE